VVDYIILQKEANCSELFSKTSKKMQFDLDKGSGPRKNTADISAVAARAVLAATASSAGKSFFDFAFKKSAPGIVNPDLNEEKFLNDILAAKKDVEKSVTIEAIEDHFSTIVVTSRLFLIIGLLTIGIQSINPVVPIVLLVLYHMSMWTIIAHHASHGGLDKTNLTKYHRKTFGKGLLRRMLDWPDLFLPEAWSIEHNKYHHYYLNEKQDPDFVEGKVARGGSQSTFSRFVFNIITICTWRWSYYCINTYKVLMCNNNSPDIDNDDFKAVTLLTLFSKKTSFIVSVIKKVFLPYLLLWWFALPMIIGYAFSCPYWEIYKKMLVIELLTNIYTFSIIVTNHCGSDLYQFKKSYPRDSAGFLLHAILGSVNYANGSNVVDFLHGYLNYQIEHHMFPDMSCLEYQLLAPKVKKICRDHGVPYLKESFLVRVVKTFRVMMAWDSQPIYVDRK
jgi:fatty acid desaturase